MNTHDHRHTALTRYYLNPTRRVLRNGCFAELPEVLDLFKPRSILLVLGEKSFRTSPYFARLEEMLAPYRVVETSAIAQNPTQSFVQNQIDEIRNKPFDLVLAIGGGSVLDVAKILAVIPQQAQTDLAIYCCGTVPLTATPLTLIAIPTTAGTGSEVTPYASLETKEKKKITISHDSFYPTLALIDPELCYSMPAYVTASTGFDALSQAIESFWSVGTTPFSRTHSLRSLELILRSLATTTREPAHAQGRWNMSLASCEAGLAIAQTKTTAVHSVSYPITAHFRIAHGHACALTLASFVRFNAPVLKDAGQPMLNLCNARDYEGLARQIEGMMDEVGLERSLTKLGIDEKGMELIVRDGFRPDRIKNNPRPVQAEDLRKILMAIR